MAKKPVIMMPFFVVAFLECLALELILFSTRKPLSFIADPIIRKLSGEAYTHYPYNLILLPKQFYYTQIIIAIFAGVFLTAVSVNILKNAISGLPIRRDAMLQNASKRYFSFVGAGIIFFILMFCLEKTDSFVYMKFMNLASKYLPKTIIQFGYIGYSLVLFFSNMIMQVFIISIIPMIVIWKEPVLKAFLKSVAFGFRNFFSVLKMILLPFLIYLPMMLFKSYSAAIGYKTFPEITVFIIAASSIITAFVDCFIVVCISRFLLEKRQISD